MKTENKKTNKPIPEGWTVTTLVEATVFNYGKGLNTKNRANGNVPVYGSNGITGFHDVALISEPGYIIGRKGTIGSIYYSKVPFYPIDTTYYLTSKDIKLNFNYFYYLFKTLNLNQLNSDSAVPGLNRNALYLLSIIIPESLIEQQAIAAVLSSLDDKIELLREQNETLEAIAQAIYKRWFVDFEFPVTEPKNSTPFKEGWQPKADGAVFNTLQLKGYKSSGGKMVESELGEIPERWRVGKIKDLIDILSGFAFSSSDFSKEGQYKLVTIKNVQDRYFNPQTKDNLMKLPKKMPDYCILELGDILISLTGNVGRICLVNGKDYLLNQRVAKLRAKNKNDNAFTYLLFLQNSIFSLIQNIASGTAQQNLSPIQMKEIKIIIADRKILDKFGIVTNKLIQKIKNNISQIQILSALRDAMLPKLMSGKIRVPTTLAAEGCHTSLKKMDAECLKGEE